MLQMLDAGEPVMHQVDMRFLDSLKLPPGHHSGGRMIVAAGDDARWDRAVVADKDGALHRVALDGAPRARDSKCEPLTTEN